MKILAILFLVAGLGFCSKPHAGQLEESFGAVSDYRFRGISQSNFQPSLANQVEYRDDSGVWVGNKLNTISKQEYPGAGLESDYFGGWHHDWADGVRSYVGDYEYTYPGAPQFNTNEMFAHLRVPYFTFKYYKSLTDYFAVPGTVGTQYFNVDNYIPVQKITWITHVGRTVSPINSLSYTDWRTGFTTNIEGIDVGVTYYWNSGVSTQFRILNTTDGHALYQNAVVLSVSKSF
jgi:uncharacterized protein (TIGR02001 family)